ncbi:hypothetical protein N825_21620 [Skermanella stibiiresistens SB22]|uniref:Uncharacterized protein n=1 Tax=Skermanella stibiiresistens SB22 TaxID=1385369 RepID=W9GTV0_9PROT|nr:hypothetical protein [Skermanella stibiiresistens]EWY37189.1 hypothetical protein N825_21620 [Skermanella stibiiresistens SB22]
MSYEQVEEAWRLSEAAREIGATLGESPGPGDYWTGFFSGSDQVDVDRTLAEGGDPPIRIFLRSPYGLRWRQEEKDWIPFRHGPVEPLPV